MDRLSADSIVHPMATSDLLPLSVDLAAMPEVSLDGLFLSLSCLLHGQ